MIRFIISNISQELLGRSGVAYAVETELSRLVLLVNSHMHDSEECSVLVRYAKDAGLIRVFKNTLV